MNILAFESSCDETSASVVFTDGSDFAVKSNIIASQIEIHKLYGGVVPEIASRAHTEAISRITYEALKTAGLMLSEIDLVAVTARPGLIGALLVGEKTPDVRRDHSVRGLPSALAQGSRRQGQHQQHRQRAHQPFLHLSFPRFN